MSGLALALLCGLAAITIAPQDANAAERAVKAPKRHQAVSGYRYTLETLARWCLIRSYLTSAANHGLGVLDAITAAMRGTRALPDLAGVRLEGGDLGVADVHARCVFAAFRFRAVFGEQVDHRLFHQPHQFAHVDHSWGIKTEITETYDEAPMWHALVDWVDSTNSLAARPSAPRSPRPSTTRCNGPVRSRNCR